MKPAKIPKNLNIAAKWYLKEIDAPLFVDESIPIAATIYTKDGKMLGAVGPSWDSYSDDLKVEILSHEAGHVAGGHDIRRGDRDPQIFNIVCDCAIHYSGGVEPWAVKELDGCTYEAFDLPPCPPEIAYDLLKERMPPQGGGGEGNGCGREKAQNQQGGDGKGLQGKAFNRAVTASIRGAKEVGMGAGKGQSGILRVIPDTIPPIPDWMIDLLGRLKKSVSYDEPTRRWVRETRLDVDPIVMPGKGQRMGIGALFIVDASGSMSEETLSTLFGAVAHTPELVNSQVVVFSDTATDPRPVRDWREALKECPSGGTQFQEGAKKRIEGMPVVWLTDGYTGDGWPDPHTDEEYWVITTEVNPPHGVRLQA